ncbi:MAG: LysM peptidoglycan-binding domain-containing protein [Chloroflexi bacterium]|nr:LysM peptidoglycan-binding domain-containing protein [Chloroflexota bacterium]
MKRLVLLCSIATLMMGAAACTREKPSEPTSAAVQALTPEATDSLTPSGAATPTSETTPGALNTTLPTALATSSTVEGPTVVPPTNVPFATSTPAAAQALSTPGTYTVQLGDWLAKIAQQFGVSTQAIIAANPGIDPNLISPGQVLNIPAAGTSVGPTPIAGSPPTTSPGTYTVKRGDWIFAIARRYGITVPELLAVNPGVNANLIYPGLVLNIPSSTSSGTNPPAAGSSSTYTVQNGDTLFTIAVQFHTSTYALQIANHLANPNFIYPGQSLIIPK